MVFVRAPTPATQRARLLARHGTETPAELERRLAAAETEERLADQFDAVVMNDDLDRAVDEIRALLAARRQASGA